jgi:hypothetical protein
MHHDQQRTAGWTTRVMLADNHGSKRGIATNVSTGRTNVSVAELEGIRRRFMPMLRVVAAEYDTRVPAGYPNLIDSPERGAVGLEIDPSHAVYITSDGSGLYADLYYRSARTDNRSSASREKYSGMPVNDRRPIAPDVSDIHLRNLVAELMARWNQQPGIIHMSDS